MTTTTSNAQAPLKAETLAELRELLAKATPGPWRLDNHHHETGYADVDSVVVTETQQIATIYGGRELQPRITRLPTFSECRANAPLIVALRNNADALLAAASSAPVDGNEERLREAPDGWQLVPKEPTEQMVKAAHQAWSEQQKRRIDIGGGSGSLPHMGWETYYYRAMLAASPPGPAPSPSNEARLREPITVLDTELSRITEYDNKCAVDLMDDLIDAETPEETKREIAQWFRKVRYGSVIADRKARNAALAADPSPSHQAAQPPECEGVAGQLQRIVDRWKLEAELLQTENARVSKTCADAINHLGKVTQERDSWEKTARDKFDDDLVHGLGIESSRDYWKVRAEKAEAERDEWRRRAEQADSDVLQNDLRDMLRALGLPDGARPQSPHDVFRECIVAVINLIAERDEARAALAQGTQP